MLAVCIAGSVSFYETKALCASAAVGGGASAAVAPFKRQVLGEGADGSGSGGGGGGGDGAAEEGEHVRDLLWLADGSDRFLALVVAGEDGCAGRLLLGDAGAGASQQAPFAIAAEVVAAAVAPAGVDSSAPPVVAWATSEGVTVAVLTHEGYPTDMRPVPVGPIRDGEDCRGFITCLQSLTCLSLISAVLKPLYCH